MLGKIGIAVCAIALLLAGIGLAIPFWRCFETLDAPSTGWMVQTRMGLWEVCVRGRSHCERLPDEAVNHTLKTVRALEVMGMFLLVGALVCAIVKALVLKDVTVLYLVAGGCALLAGIVMVSGCLVYALLYQWVLNLDVVDQDLHSGFVLCAVAGVLGIGAAILFCTRNYRVTLSDVVVV